MGLASFQQPNDLADVIHCYYSNGQFYLDSQGAHNSPVPVNENATQLDNQARGQTNFSSRRKNSPPVFSNVQGNYHWCGKTCDEVALDALAAFTTVIEYPGGTIWHWNIRSQTDLGRFEAVIFASRMLPCRSLELA